MVQMNRFAGQKLRHRCREQTYGHQGGKAVGGRGGGGMNWAIGIDMYTLMCIKLMTNKNLLYKRNKVIKCILLERSKNRPYLLSKLYNNLMIFSIYCRCIYYSRLYLLYQCLCFGNQNKIK